MQPIVVTSKPGAISKNIIISRSNPSANNSIKAVITNLRTINIFHYNAKKNVMMIFTYSKKSRISMLSD